MENPVMIFGAKNLGLTAYDIFKNNGIIVYGFLDDDEAVQNQEIDDVSVLGDTDNEGFTKLIGHKCEAFVAVESLSERKALVEMLKTRRKVMPVNAIHAKAEVSSLASIGHGNLIGMGVSIGPKVELGSHCIILPKVSIEPQTTVGDFVQIGVGSNIGAEAEIADGAFIGAGVTVVSGIKIGKNARVGAGSVVVENVAANSTVFGNPAKKI